MSASTPRPSALSVSLAGRIALVTGAAGGLGSAMARILAACGSDVALLDHPDASAKLGAVASDVRAIGARVVEITADLAVKSQVDRAAAQAETELGPVDILINCAGVYKFPLPLLEADEATWDYINGVNVKGTLFISQAMLPGMIARGRGAVVHIASDSAFDAIAGEAIYGTSKATCAKMVAYFAKELSGTGVRINAIAPGYIRTQLTQPIWSDSAALAEAVAGIPMRRLAEPEDIANVAAFLVSDLASYVHGQCVVVDGGRVAGRPS